jgi:AcrR family transcriptional regulator
MAGDAEATKKRLLEAATREFAEHGIAGARVDRIATAARSNKAQIYHYFKNKDGLFDAVMTELALETVRDAPINPLDLPEYAGQLFDRFSQDPVKARLANWYRLEGSGYAAVNAVVASTRDKVAVIADAQQEGLIPRGFTPVELLALVVHLSTLWSSMSPELAKHAEHISDSRRRDTVVRAVAALLRG